jgi:hypothetical protein
MVYPCARIQANVPLQLVPAQCHDCIAVAARSQLALQRLPFLFRFLDTGAGAGGGRDVPQLLINLAAEHSQRAQRVDNVQVPELDARLKCADSDKGAGGGGVLRDAESVNRRKSIKRGGGGGGGEITRRCA